MDTGMKFLVEGRSWVMVSVSIEGTRGTGRTGLGEMVMLVLDIMELRYLWDYFFSYSCLLRYNWHTANLPFLMGSPTQLDRCI